MKNLAILIDKPDHSQKFLSMTAELNKLSSQINITVFYCEPGPIPNKINFPVVELLYGYLYDGKIIATDIFTANVMNNMMGDNVKYYYPWDLEYIYQPYPIDMLRKVFSNKLIARNQDRFDILASTWHEPELIIEDFNGKQLERLFST